MPEFAVVVGRATRLNRIVFASAGLFALASMFVLSRDESGSAAGWSGIPGRRLYVVTSGSMSPAIHVGDAVLVRPVDAMQAASLKLGDVVTFRAANNPRFLITHRIVAVRSSAAGRRFFETKGDANGDRDGSVLVPERVVGVVTQVVPRLGSVVVALRTPGVIGLFVVAFLLFELALAAFRRSAASTHDVMTARHADNSH